MENQHINESILSEEILEDQKKNRIDHMTYLPGMEDSGQSHTHPEHQKILRRFYHLRHFRL